MKITRTGLITETGVIPITIAVLTASLPPLPEVYDDDAWTEPFVPEDWAGPSVN
jgi:hypothetical protein